MLASTTRLASRPRAGGDVPSPSLVVEVRCPLVGGYCVLSRFAWKDGRVEVASRQTVAVSVARDCLSYGLLNASALSLETKCSHDLEKQLLLGAK